MRASNARPYGIACTSDDNVGATIGRPLLAATRRGGNAPRTLEQDFLRKHGDELPTKAALTGSESFTVSSAPSTPGDQRYMYP